MEAVLGFPNTELTQYIQIDVLRMLHLKHEANVKMSYSTVRRCRLEAGSVMTPGQ